MALTSISDYCGINLGGLSRLLYIPHTWIDAALYSRIVAAQRVHAEIPLIDEYDWLSLPLLHRGRNFIESPQRSEQGVSYEHSISGVAPHLRSEVTDLLEEMEQYRYLVLLTDRNAKTWLIGTKDAPLSFRAEADGGSDSGLNNYRFSFSGQSPRRMYGYVIT